MNRQNVKGFDSSIISSSRRGIFMSTGVVGIEHTKNVDVFLFNLLFKCSSGTMSHVKNATDTYKEYTTTQVKGKQCIRYERVQRNKLHVERTQRKCYEHVARTATATAADKAQTMMPRSGFLLI